MADCGLYYQWLCRRIFDWKAGGNEEIFVGICDWDYLFFDFVWNFYVAIQGTSGRLAAFVYDIGFVCGLGDCGWYGELNLNYHRLCILGVVYYFYLKNDRL